jgi:glucose-6-phosphate isomerase
MQLSDNPITPVLRKKAKAIRQHRLESLIREKNRESSFIFNLDDLKIDLTRNYITEDILNDLLNLAKKANVSKKIQALLDGKIINASENLAVEHIGMRDPNRFTSNEWIRLERFVSKTRQKNKFKSIINIGIGGSELGLSAVAEIMKNHITGPNLHFVSNVDPIHISDILSSCDPASTLVVISSKSFNTVEVLENAKIVWKWLSDNGVQHQGSMVAVTAFPKKAISWGISSDQVFEIPKSIGGRFSVWSSIGLPLLIGLGIENFKKFLKGGYAMDQHFAETPFERNIPVLLALLRIWNRNFFEYGAHAILPYEPKLKKFISWVQQLEMESNGKGVDLQGSVLQMPAAPLIWGDVGTNWQHSFGQFLMQGIEINPVDILFARKPNLEGSLDIKRGHRYLLSNVLAQANVLAFGSLDNLNKYENCEGNRPSNLISWETTSPYAIGRLLALYEYITIVCGFIWDINSFDQWGVESGKKLAQELIDVDGFEL